MAAMETVPLAKRKAAQPPRWMRGRLPRNVQIHDESALPIRVYRPAGTTEALPIVAFAHGGGFVNCGLDAMQYTCAIIAALANVEVASVDYPLAPEEPFPAALECYYDVLCRLSHRKVPMTVMGDSAGGNLAAAVCLLARDRGGPEIAQQILIYPTLDATLSTPQMAREKPGRRAECAAFYSYYLAGGSRSDQLVSPLLAEDLTTLPPATIITADHDSFRDEGRIYARRLRKAGVSVRYTNYVAMPHGFLSMPRLCRAAPQALTEIAAALANDASHEMSPRSTTAYPARSVPPRPSR
jgi:acetyl esterase